MIDDSPVFSVVEEGGDIVVPTGSPMPARLPFGVLAAVAGGAGVWFLLVASIVVSAFEVVEFRWWFVVVMVVLFLVALVFTSTVSDGVESLYGQHSASMRVAGVAAYLGFGLGGAGTALAFQPDSEWIVVPLFIGSVCLLRAPFAMLGARRALRYARARQEVVRHVHRYGLRVPGVITAVRFRERWHQGRPEFFVDIACALGVVTANMVTQPDRVPVAGSAVVVAHEGIPETMLVYLAADARFQTNVSRYHEPEE